MRIYCTKKFQDLIGKIEELPSEPNEITINDWSLHLIYIDRQKTLIFINNQTSYTIFIANFLKKNLKDIESIFKARLQEQLIHDEIIKHSEEVESIFFDLKMKFHKTNNNKKVIGRINNYSAILKAHCFYKYNHVDEMDLVYENGLINNMPIRKPAEGKKSWSTSVENLKEIIKTNTH